MLLKKILGSTQVNVGTVAIVVTVLGYLISAYWSRRTARLNYIQSILSNEKNALVFRRLCWTSSFLFNAVELFNILDVKVENIKRIKNDSHS